MNPKILLTVSLLFGLAAILIVVLFYVYGGGFSGPLSTNSTDWGVFGDYFGGVLGAVFGFVSFILLLATVLLQEQQIERMYDESLKQNHVNYMNEIYSDIKYLFARKLKTKNEEIEFGDLVVGSSDSEPLDNEAFSNILDKLHQNLSEYSLALRLYKDNFDEYFQYRAHKRRVTMLANFLKKHEYRLGSMADPSLGIIFQNLEAD